MPGWQPVVNRAVNRVPDISWKRCGLARLQGSCPTHVNEGLRRKLEETQVWEAVSLKKIVKSVPFPQRMGILR